MSIEKARERLRKVKVPITYKEIRELYDSIPKHKLIIPKDRQRHFEFFARKCFDEKLTIDQAKWRFRVR